MSRSRERASRGLAALCLALALSATQLARAQEESGETTESTTEAESEGANRASATEVRAPVPLHTPVLPVTGEDVRVEIVLELSIDEQGRVASARAINGSDPYATAAVRATKSWTFRPAKRGERNVPSKIHFLVTFEPAPEPLQEEAEPVVKDRKQAETEAEADPGRPTPPDVAPRAKAAQLSEVLVLGEPPDPGALTVTRTEVRNLAGAFDDPLRSMEVLPGVTPILTGLPLFFVRGAPPGNVGFFLDGIRIPLLYHGFLGPSVIHPAFLEKVTLHGGPAPVRFGRHAGAVVDAELANPRGELRAEGNVRLFDAGAFVEAPYAGERGYALLGGRYSFTSLLLSAFTPGVSFGYWDYQALIGYHLTRQDEVSLFSFGAYDFFGSETTGLGTEFHRLDLRYKHDFSSRSTIRLAGTWGFERSGSDVGVTTDDSLGGRMNFLHRGEDVIVRAGGDVMTDRFGLQVDPAISEPEIYLALFPPRTDVAGGAYLDFVLFPQGRIQVIPGVRADVFSSLGDVAFSVDPRVFAEYQLTPNLKASHGLAVAHQSANFVPNVPGAQVGGLQSGLQRSVQASSAFIAELPWQVTASVGGFINGTWNLSDPFGLSQAFAPDETADENRSFGRAAGIEVYLKRPLTRRIGGLLSYTYSRALRSYDKILTPPGYDRPHVLNAALTYDFGAHWQASGKFALASGIPGQRTTLDGLVYDQSRSDPLVRLDLKLAKRWYVNENFYWGAHAEVLNATYTGSVSRRICSVMECENQGTAPIIIPSLGVEAAWN